MAYTVDQQHEIADEDALRSLYPATHELARVKCLGSLDLHARAFIERAPFLCLGTQNARGSADVSPRGDPAGFVRVLDDNTLAIPDRPGNNRLDSLSNILANPAVGLLFIVPGFDDTLRVNGRARLVTAPALLAEMTVNGRAPTLAILVDVHEVFLHCAKAFRRSRLWDPEHFRDRRELPSLANMILDQTTGAPEDSREMARIDADLEEGYRRSMY
ncbi:pyridoxamine 5'-phosphate oxidase family protein [Sulfitobacter sp. LCG007]